MIKKIAVAAAGVFLAWSLATGETITAGSDVFTFPAISSVKNGLSPYHPVYFRCSGNSPRSSAMVFAWSIPAGLKADHGTITVHSLLGKTIRQFRLNSRSGSIVWKNEANNRMAPGIYFARFAFGSFIQNSTLIINK